MLLTLYQRSSFSRRFSNVIFLSSDEVSLVSAGLALLSCGFVPVMLIILDDESDRLTIVINTEDQFQAQ